MHFYGFCIILLKRRNRKIPKVGFIGCTWRLEGRKDMNRTINIPIFVSHQGCPNDCIFCNQKRITGVCNEENETQVREKIESFLSTCRDREATKEIAFFGGSFTGIETKKQLQYLQIAQQYIRTGEVSGIRISTRPDYIDSEICQRLAEYHVTTVELGVQSMDDEVLFQNRRGMKASSVEKAVSLLRKYPFALGLQMMTGMFGSDEEKDFKTAEALIRLRPDFVRIYPTVVLKDTGLMELYQQGHYRPMELEASIHLSARLLDLFETARIPVIRLGLMAGEEIHERQVIGPYHSAYRELVESYRICCDIERQLRQQATKGKQLVLTCPPSMVSKVVGNRKKNVLFLQERYGVTVHIIQDPHLEQLKLEIK